MALAAVSGTGDLCLEPVAQASLEARADAAVAENKKAADLLADGMAPSAHGGSPSPRASTPPPTNRSGTPGSAGTWGLRIAAAGAAQWSNEQPLVELKDPNMEESTPKKRGPVYPSYSMLLCIEKSTTKEKQKVINEKYTVLKEERINTASIRQYESDLKTLHNKKRTINRKLWEKDREVRRLESAGDTLSLALRNRRMGHTPEPSPMQLQQLLGPLEDAYTPEDRCRLSNAQVQQSLEAPLE